MSVHGSGPERPQRGGPQRARRGLEARRGLRRPLLPGQGPLARVPPAAVFLAIALVLAVGLVVGGVVGALLLGLLALGVVVLLAATWPRLRPSQRVGRVLILGVLVLVGVGLLTRGGIVR